MAERAVNYWKARRDLQCAVACAQTVGIAEGQLQPPTDHDEHWDLVKKWRAALARQLLTPAPDLAAVRWKQAFLNSSEAVHNGVKTSQVERSIADDIAFLAAHPFRKGGRKAPSAF